MPAVILPSTPPVLLLAPYQSAAYILDQMPDGGRVVGLQKGQASLTDLAVAAAERLGKSARVLLFSWGMSLEDLALLQRCHEDGRISQVQIRLDSKRAGEERFGVMVASFGAENVTSSAMHAEVATIRSADNTRAIVVRGSMGNNRNAQFQQLDVEESITAADLVQAHHATPQRFARFPQAKTEPHLATAALQSLARGRVFGISAGFSLAALVNAALDRTGPADVEIVTWSAAAESLEAVNAHPSARKIRLVVGEGYIHLPNSGASAILRAIQRDAFRVARTHAKIVTIRNADHSITIRGSMNLAPNPRAEQFDIEDDTAIADFFTRWIDELFLVVPADARRNVGAMANHFKNGLNGGLALDAYAERDQRPTSNGDRLDMAALAQAPKSYAPDTLAALMAPPKQLTLL